MGTVWMKPIGGAKAWRGSAIDKAGQWYVPLSKAELDDIDRAVVHAKKTGLPLEQIGRDEFPLNAMRDRLRAFLDEIYDGRGFVVAKGLPVSKYSDEDVGLIFWGLGRYLGSPLYQNPMGDLLGHVYDHGRRYGNIDVRGYETNAYLPYHTDGCDLIGLLCLRRALKGGLSSIVSSVTVHNEILAKHPEYLGLLYNGFYYIRREEALSSNGVSDRPVPVFGCQDGVLSCRYIRNQINAGAVKRNIPLTTLEKEALDYLDSLTSSPELRFDMDLQPGDMQLCNNYTILHSRTEFLDGDLPHQKRHMVRLWLKFPRPWPIHADFPEQNGYMKATGGASQLVEA